MADELTVTPHADAHFVRDALVERVEIDHSALQRILRPVRAAPPLGSVQRFPLSRKFAALVLEPVRRSRCTSSTRPAPTGRASCAVGSGSGAPATATPRR